MPNSEIDAGSQEERHKVHNTKLVLVLVVLLVLSLVFTVLFRALHSHFLFFSFVCQSSSSPSHPPARMHTRSHDVSVEKSHWLIRTPPENLFLSPSWPGSIHLEKARYSGVFIPFLFCQDGRQDRQHTCSFGFSIYLYYLCWRDTKHS